MSNDLHLIDILEWQNIVEKQSPTQSTQVDAFVKFWIKMCLDLTRTGRSAPGVLQKPGYWTTEYLSYCEGMES